MSLQITSADGAKARWGGDERDARKLPTDLTFSTEIPGPGFNDLSCSLRRRRDDELFDLDRLDLVQALGPGGEIAWQGRNVEFPWHTGEDYGLQVNAVGLGTDLTFDPTFSEHYIGRDLGAWTGPSANRAFALAALNAAISDPVTGSEDTEYGLTLQIVGAWVAGQQPRSEAWLDAGSGNKIKRIIGNYEGYSDAGFILVIEGSDNQTNTADATSDLYITTTGSIDSTLANAHRFIVVGWRYNANPGGQDGKSYWCNIHELATIGDHGLSLQGTVGSGSEGFFASDVIADILSRSAPNLPVGLIEPTSFPIPHLVIEPMTPAEAIERVNAFHLYDWGVYESFFWRPPSSYRRNWLLRVEDGASIDLAGETSETAVNGVIVEFSDPGGVSRTAGPVGSGCEYEDATLQDDDQTNVVNAHGIQRKYAKLTLSSPATVAAALQIGARFLVEAKAASFRGSVSAKGEVIDADTNVAYPAWAMRGGDSVRVVDEDNIEHRVVSTNYTHESRSISGNVDNTPHRLDALLAQYGAKLVGAGG